jgi:hypothetical protein
MIPAFQGVPPSRAFLLSGGSCRWHSDYWFSVAGLDVLAERFRLTVTPSVHVHVTSEHASTPVVCE